MGYSNSIYLYLYKVTRYLAIFISLIMLYGSLRMVFSKENQLIKGSCFDIFNVFRIEIFISIALIILLVMFLDLKKIMLRKVSIISYLMLVVLIRGLPIIVYPNLWYIEEYWRIGRSYEVYILNHIKLIGLNEENPYPFIFMATFLKITEFTPLIATKIFDLFILFSSSLIIYCIIKNISSRKGIIIPLLFWSLVYVPLGHFSRQDYVFPIYLVVLLILINSIKCLNRDAKMMFLISILCMSMVLSHPANPLILFINIISIILLIEIYYIFISCNQKQGKNQYMVGQQNIKPLIYSILVLLITWIIWHIIIGVNEYDMLYTLRNSVIHMINSIYSYGLSSEAITSSRQIVYINSTYYIILLAKQFFVLFTLGLSIIVLILVLRNHEIRHNYLTMTIIGLHLSNIVLLVLIVFSGHVPLRGTLMFSVSLVMLISMFSLTKQRILRYFHNLIIAILVIGLLVSPFLVYSAIPIIYADTSELYLIKYSIVYKNIDISPYIVEYNGPIMGYFFGQGNLPLYIPPNRNNIAYIVSGAYKPLLITHRIRYRDNFFIYNMSSMNIFIKSYNQLYRVLFDAIRRNQKNLIYIDTIGNMIIY